jgi:hypothetical protein
VRELLQHFANSSAKCRISVIMLIRQLETVVYRQIEQSQVSEAFTSILNFIFHLPSQLTKMTSQVSHNKQITNGDGNNSNKQVKQLTIIPNWPFEYKRSPTIRRE